MRLQLVVLAIAAATADGFAPIAPFAHSPVGRQSIARASSLASARSSTPPAPPTLAPAAETIPDGTATAIATGTVDAPIDKVWGLLSNFEGLNDWWPIYTDYESTGNDIGDTRTFGFKDRAGVTTKEVLVARDPSNHVLRYDLVSLEGLPLPIEAIQTVVSLTANGDSTNVLWRSWTQSSAVNMLVGSQAKGYQDGIDHLQSAINPSLGTLDVTVVSGENLSSNLLVTSYANIAVDGAPPVTVKSKEFGSSPSFRAAPACFDLLKEESKVRITVFEREMGIDRWLGNALVDLQKEGLTSGEPVTMTLDLEGSKVGATVTVDLEMTLRTGDVLPLSKAQQEVQSLKKLEGAVNLLKGRAFDILKFASAPELPVWEYSRKAGLPANVKGLPRSEVLPPHKVGLIFNAIFEYIESQFDLQRRLIPVANTYERYAAYFSEKGKGGYIPKPSILYDNLWAQDEEFLRQIFAGLNPIHVRVVESEDKASLPAKLLALKAKDGSDVDKLVEEKRLYVLDYKALRHLDRSINGVTLYAPTMLIYRTGAEELSVLGILLEPEREDAPVYAPDSSPPNKYLFAKLHVNCADNQVHQFTNHLGFTHLAVEPMAVACHNVLEKNKHPLGGFLKPHFRDNIGINYLARQTLVADEGAITDQTFATGTAQGVQMVQEAFVDYDFMTSGLPDELAKRGFGRSDEFNGYRYRDDGYLIWDTLWSYCSDMVDELYESDADVKADKIIQEWCTEACTKADISGFPESIVEKEVLVKVLTTIVWTASAQHSALNYVQYPYTSTPINRPASIFGGVPDGEEDITTADILAAVPGGTDPRGFGLAIFQGLVSWLLASPENPTLDQIGERIPNSNNPIEWVEFRSQYPTVYNNLKRNLDAVELIINKRNEGVTIPYEVLLPSKVAASINI